jgi:antitoxin (DNA-binding transcriptional repressor) of toxin-antitoxin stability system
MRQIELAEISTHLNAVLATALQDEIVLITQEQKPVLKLLLVNEGAKNGKKARRKRGSAKGLIRIADDFDEPLPELNEYMQ